MRDLMAYRLHHSTRLNIFTIIKRTDRTLRIKKELKKIDNRVLAST